MKSVKIAKEDKTSVAQVTYFAYKIETSATPAPMTKDMKINNKKMINKLFNFSISEIYHGF